MDALEVLRERRSVRAYDATRPVAREQIETMVDCARFAATARNVQPWEFVVVTDPAVRASLAALAANGPFIADAPVCIAVVCREGTYYFVVDRSGSSGFGSDARKDGKMLEVAASLMFAAQKNHERIGLCVVTDRVECFVPARQGRAHLIHLLSVLIYHRPQNRKTDIGSAIRFLSKILIRRSSIIILSDFLSPLSEPALRILRHHHEVIAIRIADIREQELPDVGLVALEDMETGEQVLLDTSDGTVRSRYREVAREEDDRILSRLRKHHTRTITLMSGDSSFIPLRRFFSSRQQGRSG